MPVFGLILTTAAAGLMHAWVRREDHGSLEGSAPLVVLMMVIGLAFIVLAGVALWA